MDATKHLAREAVLSVDTAKHDVAQGDSLLEDMAYAHRVVLSHMPYGKTWLWNGTDLAPKLHDPGVQDLEYPSYESGSAFGAIRTLPRAPELLKGENRTLWIAMENVYRAILYNRATYIRKIFAQDDYTLDNRAGCDSFAAFAGEEIEAEDLITEGQQSHAPLMFSDIVISCKDKRLVPSSERVVGNDQHNNRVGYSPLDSTTREIRLLALSPAMTMSELHGELILVSLAAVPSHDSIRPFTDPTMNESFDSEPRSKSHQPFEALSYVWGRSNRGEIINLEGIGSLQITDNLASALRRLRLSDGIRMLWVDSICINQADLQERSQQVQLMGPIYGKASRVLVWLGDATVGQHLPIQYPFQFEYDRTIWHGHGQLIERNPLDELQDWKARTLVEVIQNTQYSFWWERMWIVQEFALARFMPVACFGEFEIPWNELRFLTEVVYGGKTRLGWENVMALGRLNEFSSYIQGLLRQLADGELDVHRAVFFTRRCIATDPRDRVFALLSLLGDSKRGSINPDYTKSCHSVFIEATMAFANVETNLDFLLLVTGTRSDTARMPMLPTWAIDFTFGDRYAQIGADLDMPMEIKTGTWWNPTQPQKTCQRFDIGHDMLHISGLCLDRVSKILPLPRSRFDVRYPSALFNRTVRDCRNTMLNLPLMDPYESLLTKCEPSLLPRTIDWDVMDTVTSRDWSDLAETQPSGLYPRRNDIADVVRHILEAWSRTVGIPKSRTYQFCRQDARGSYEEWESYGRFFSGASILFTTTAGFIGIAPDSVLVGDYIVLPLAYRIPIVLRSIGPEFTFQGLAFVHGVMEGELAERAPAIMAHTEEFAIV